ncbi:MAG: AAA family ATPase, partial [Bacteroidetes bacterium]|nr:AAA family ATPase [Bacteroidota bacterium]
VPEKIILKNFKCLSNLELSFEKDKNVNRKWTIIIGENGTGKSNVLKSISLITAGSNSLGELLGNANDWISYNQPGCVIEAVLETKRVM